MIKLNTGRKIAASLHFAQMYLKAERLFLSVSIDTDFGSAFFLASQGDKPGCVLWRDIVSRQCCSDDQRAA
jgi:hypothetical protein